MKSLNVVLVLVGLLFVGCGGGDSTPSQSPKTEVLDVNDINETVDDKNNTVMDINDTIKEEIIVVDTTENYHIAQDNTVHDVNVTFGTFTIVVYADASIDTISQSTKAIYGKINGSPTDALLTVSSNYIGGTAFIVKVFKENKLVGESSKAILTGGTLEFSDITTK